jgi:hypothetical protein
MKENLDGRTKPGILHRTISPFETTPEVNLAAKTGAPAMQSIRPAMPVSVPSTAAGTASGVSDVAIGQVGDTQAIDQKADARLGVPGGAAPADASPAAPGAAPTEATVTPTAAAATPNGTGEQKASVGSTGLAANPASPLAQPTEQLPTNHPPTKDQLNAMKKAQAKAAKQQKKQKPASTTTAPAAAAGATPATGAVPASTSATPAPK